MAGINVGLARLVGISAVFGLFVLAIGMQDNSPAAPAPAQPAVSRTVPATPPSSVTPVPPTSEPSVPESDDGGVVVVPVPVPGGDDDHHREHWPCRHHWWC